MKTLTQIRTTGSEGLLVAFGRRKSGPDEPWCMLLDAGSVATIARTGREIVFTAREIEAPVFNPHLHWVVTLLFSSEADAEVADSNLRLLLPVEFFVGEKLTGIIAHCGHSFQAIGVPSSMLDAIAKQRGLTLTLVSSEGSEHRDYYAVSERG